VDVECNQFYQPQQAANVASWQSIVLPSDPCFERRLSLETRIGDYALVEDAPAGQGGDCRTKNRSPKFETPKAQG
jgi:hypothetical protein